MSHCPTCNGSGQFQDAADVVNACTACGGTGIDPRPDCGACGGRRWQYDPNDGGTMTCSACNGSGKDDDQEGW